MEMQPELNIMTTAEHDKVAIHEEVADNERFYTSIIMVSILIIVVVLVL